MATSHTEVWQRATVLSAEYVAASIKRIAIRVDRPVPVKPGEHVNVRVAVQGVTQTRSFSIVEGSPTGSELVVSVFESEQTRGGATAMHALTPGDSFEVTQPLQDFPLRYGADRYLLLAGGVGVTAIAGMAAALRQTGAEYALVYAGRSRSAMAYLGELQALHGDRLQVHVRDEGSSLRVTELVDRADAGTELYMCGPIRLMDDVRRTWLQRGFPVANLRFETFGNSGWYEPQEFVVRIPSLGFETVVSSSQSMLEAIEAAGQEMMYDCRKGECGLCEVRVLELEGVIDHRDVFYSERQKDARSKLCCCVSRAFSPDGGGRAVISIQPS